MRKNPIGFGALFLNVFMKKLPNTSHLRKGTNLNLVTFQTLYSKHFLIF